MLAICAFTYAIIYRFNVGNIHWYARAVSIAMVTSSYTNQNTQDSDEMGLHISRLFTQDEHTATILT